VAGGAVEGDVLDRHRQAEAVLRAADPVGDVARRARAGGEREEIVEAAAALAGPAEVVAVPGGAEVGEEGADFLGAGHDKTGKAVFYVDADKKLVHNALPPTTGAAPVRRGLPARGREAQRGRGQVAHAEEAKRRFRRNKITSQVY